MSVFSAYVKKSGKSVKMKAVSLTPNIALGKMLSFKTRFNTDVIKEKEWYHIYIRRGVRANRPNKISRRDVLLTDSSPVTEDACIEWRAKGKKEKRDKS